jgi:hypothetical protein
MIVELPLETFAHQRTGMGYLQLIFDVAQQHLPRDLLMLLDEILLLNCDGCVLIRYSSREGARLTYPMPRPELNLMAYFVVVRCGAQVEICAVIG